MNKPWFILGSKSKLVKKLKRGKVVERIPRNYFNVENKYFSGLI